MIKIVKRNFIIWVIFMFKRNNEKAEIKKLKNKKQEKTNKIRAKTLSKKSIKVSLVITFIILLFSTVIFMYFTNNSEVEALSKYGSRGNEVRKIHEKL